MASGVGAACEELPPDGTCDECEPDEAPGAEEVCRDCGFCYCRRHADAHRQKFLSHRLAAYVHGAQAWTPPASGDDALPEDVEAKGEAEGEVESEVGEEESESEVDSESEEESETEEDRRHRQWEGVGWWGGESHISCVCTQCRNGQGGQNSKSILG